MIAESVFEHNATEETLDLSAEVYAATLQEIVQVEVDEQRIIDALTQQRQSQGERAAPPFFSFLYRFINYSSSKLQEGLGRVQVTHGLAALPINDGVYQDLLNGLAGTLLNQSMRALVLELNVKRLLGQLPGEQPQDRFLYFSDRYFLQRGNFEAVLDDYPVLARLLTASTIFWVHNTLAFLQRYLHDRHAIRDTFFDGRDVGALQRITTGISDPHRQGRSVIQLVFEGGQHLIYKPKSLAVDQAFQHLLGWLNGLPLPHQQRLISVLDRATYGWLEYVDAAPCEHEEQVERFYWRQGSYLALLYVLNAVDFHHENLIAAGEYPVLIDLEGLFHNQFPDPETGRAYDIARRRLDGTVLRSGLLPLLIFGKNAEHVVDLSGLGGEGDQPFPEESLMLTDEQTDTMRFVQGFATLKAAANRPSLHGNFVKVAQHTDHIVAGFTETYALFVRHREALRQRLAAFADVEVRHIVRATMHYGRFLQEGCHPDYLQHEAARAELLEKLRAVSAQQPAFERLVGSEIDDLQHGDIPTFAARPGHRHLWDSRGRLIPDFFENGCLDTLFERLEALSSADCDEQVGLIRKALAVKEPISGDKKNLEVAQTIQVAPAETPTNGSLLDGAIRVGAYLQEKAIFGRDDVTWIGLNPATQTQEHWALAPLSVNLYDGVSGMALFFAYLAQQTGREDFKATARAAVESLRFDFDHLETYQEYFQVGAFTGVLANLYVFHHCATLWGEPALLDEALQVVPYLDALIDRDTQLDLMGGVAGTAIVLLNLYEATGKEAFLEAALRCGRRLIDTASEMPQGKAWLTEAADHALTGFSHGAAGMAWALLRLAAHTTDTAFRALALEALAYERSLFNPILQNWADLRGLEQDEAVGTTNVKGFFAWCHGAPGVALGRALALPFLNDTAVREEIELGIGTTLRIGFGGSHCLCHGDLGNADILQVCGSTLDNETWRQAAQTVGQRVLNQVQAGTWRCGLKNYVETPGLMVGLAGIGYGLLRLDAPEAVPSVIALQPPRAAY